MQITMSLDGFVAGPNIRLEEPLGDGGERLHDWRFELATWSEMQGQSGGTTGPADDMVRAARSRTGATIMGRRMVDPVPGGWGPSPVGAPGARTRTITTRYSCLPTTGDPTCRWRAGQRSIS